MRLMLAWLVPMAACAGVEARAEILVHPQGWRFPNIMTSTKEIIRVADRTPRIPGKETIRRGYRKRDGTFFMTYEIEGRIFGVEVDTNGKPPFEFSIMDTDGDGKFETKIINEPGNDDRAYVPQWVIDHYFSLHPEVKQAPADARPIPPNIEPPRPAADPKSAPEPPEKKLPPPEIRNRPNP